MKFFLLPTDMQENLARTVEARVKALEEEFGHEIEATHPPKHYPHAIRTAAVIEVAELHTFVDARGSEYQICAMSQDEARRIAEGQPWIARPVHWTGCSVPLPGQHIVRTGQYGPEEMEEMGIRVEEPSPEPQAQGE